MKSNIALLLALLEMRNRSSDIRKGTARRRHVLGTLVVRKAHGEVVVQGLERQLVSEDHTLVLGLVLVELGDAALGSLHRVVDRSVLEDLLDLGNVITKLHMHTKEGRD